MNVRLILKYVYVVVCMIVRLGYVTFKWVGGMIGSEVFAWKGGEIHSWGFIQRKTGVRCGVD